MPIKGEVVKEVKKAETQHRGKKSCATRDLTETEYRKVVHELYGKGSFESTIRTACMLKQQVHLITRTDDISKLKYSDYKPHPDFPFALSCKVHWSKNISEEQTMPRPNILGSMDTDFCYMEASFNYGYGAAGREDAFLFTPESDPKLAPNTATQPTATFSRLSFCRLHFWLWRSHCGVLGSHSIRKFAATLARGMGATADEVDIRGRWKARLSGRVVDAYISPEQPWIDARVAEKLCMGAPIAYKLHPDAKRVTPRLRMEPPVRVRIQDAYERIKADVPVGVNPVVKVPLSIWTHNTKLHINEIEPMDTGGGGGTAGGTTGTTGQASTRQVANQSRQVTAMQTQQQVRTNEEILTRIIAQHNQLQQLIAQEGRTRDSSAAALRGWLETWLGAELTKLNGNICRIAVQPPRMATPDQVDGNLFRNGLTVERTRRNGQTSLRYRQAVATTPADSRPAKLAKYRTGLQVNLLQEEALWTLMATLVNAQKAPAWVISKIEEHYKEITAAIKQDTIMGSLHEDLCIVRAQ
ncbi:unknown protein [Seminavis robusta]|uniref:Uncharacterized protein n=1 Tax=Seminavis robusta TaxID=568900 RepID=A0A9N8EJC7_9STRA|nr:unknown protein [Seminavis robusta]|eukprot:Sro1079_g238900.1 n/a (526) ;mRNA; f:18701-20633